MSKIKDSFTKILCPMPNLPCRMKILTRNKPTFVSVPMTSSALFSTDVNIPTKFSVSELPGSLFLQPNGKKTLNFHYLKRDAMNFSDVSNFSFFPETYNFVFPESLIFYNQYPEP